MAYTQAQETMITAEMSENGYTREEAIQVLTSRGWKSAGSSGSGFNWGFLGKVAEQVPSLVSQFDRKGKQTELEIAQANAAAAQANASTTPKSSWFSGNNLIYAIAAIIVLLLVFMFFFKKQKQ